MNRKILYGYQIRDGVLTSHPQEAEGVKLAFSLYLEGITQLQVAEALNDKGFYYSPESPMWHRLRVRQMLLNPRYTGERGYPPLIDSDTFQSVQAMMTDRTRQRGGHPALCLVKKLRCGSCGHSLRRVSEKQWKDTLHFLCDCCGAKFTIADAALLAEIDRQAAEYAPQPAESGYAPSEDTVRLTNAINRGLENPEHPEDVVGLILQGISARYACVPTQTHSIDIQRLIKEKDFDQAIQYITITADNAVTVTFK